MWKRGEHVAVIGETGSGKTYLLTRLLEYRRAVIVLRTKPDDNVFPGFLRIRSLSQMRSGHTRYVLEPPLSAQRAEARRLCQLVWKYSSVERGSWCVAFDELFYCDAKLGIRDDIEMLLTQGRSKGISVVVGMQRPVGVSRWALSEPSHVFSFALEGRDIKTLVESTTPRLKPILPELPRFIFAYFDRKTRGVSVGDANHLGELLGVNRMESRA